MTKQEILNGLEGLKDMVNYNGRAAIDALKVAVMGLMELPPIQPVPPQTPPPQPEEKPKPKKIVPHGTKKKARVK